MTLERPRYMNRSATVISLLISGTLACLEEDRSQASHGVIRGQVTDSATGAPVPDAKAAVGCAGCFGRHSTDSLGRFLIPDVPPGTHVVEFHCPSRTDLGRELTNREITVAPGAVINMHVDVPPGGCYEPAYSERRGTFRGRFTSGLESSEFEPCLDREVGLVDGLLPGKHLYTPSVWVEFPDSTYEHADWPDDVPLDDWGSRQYFVVWHGTLEGPGTYGHLGVSSFVFYVDSIHSVRPAGPADCAAQP